jgi:hypothetical protein
MEELDWDSGHLAVAKHQQQKQAEAEDGIKYSH